MNDDRKTSLEEIWKFYCASLVNLSDRRYVVNACRANWTVHHPTSPRSYERGDWLMRWPEHGAIWRNLVTVLCFSRDPEVIKSLKILCSLSVGSGFEVLLSCTLGSEDGLSHPQHFAGTRYVLLKPAGERFLVVWCNLVVKPECFLNTVFFGYKSKLRGCCRFVTRTPHHKRSCWM